MSRMLVALLFAGCAMAQSAMPPNAPKPFLLWPNGAPAAQGTEDIDKPALYPYVVAAGQGTGSAVVICPGGGYSALAIEKEGDQIARWFNSIGVTAFVLRYRLGPKYHHPVELGDAQRAIRTVRSRAAEYRIQPDRVGIMGFSAGGHLASTAGTHFDSVNTQPNDPVDAVSSRPDFLILGYPVITLTTPLTHQGSRNYLLGNPADPKLVDLLSNELQVTAQTPPTFLFHTTNDSAVPVENSVLFYSALRKAGVPAEMHLYERGPHGVGLAQTDATLVTWTARLADWLRGRSLLNGGAR